MMREHILQHIHKAVASLIDQGLLPKEVSDASMSLGVSRAKDKQLYDYASNVAMMLAKTAKRPPQEIAAKIEKELQANTDFFANVDVAPPGFINMTLSDTALAKIIPHIAGREGSFGRSQQKNPQRVLIEFVSANPTGGLHLGHARGAFVGDAIARLLDAAGFVVTKEFYINDTGNQIETLARTIYKRYLELFGQTVSIEPGEYPGEYVKDIAQALKRHYGDQWLNKPEEEWLETIAQFGVGYNLALIKRSLDSADIEFDEWYFESTLHKTNKLDELVDAYDARNMLYEADVAASKSAQEKIRRKESKAAQFAHLQEGGLFIKTSQFGDEEDRIIKRRDGRFVYLTADLAYHHQKFERGFDLLVDVFGGDHAGHINRIKAGMEALGHPVHQLKFIVVQMVRLIKGGQEVRFSKRAGEVVGLDDLIDEVGKEVARFVFLIRGFNTQFDLDLDEITKQSNENPVFYVQYGHARMATILRRARDEHGLVVDAKKFDASLQALLTLPEERDLLLRINDLDHVVKEAAEALEPHRLIYFCQELIKTFHSYFTKYRHTEKIISNDKEKTTARLMLVFAIKQTIFNALFILGITAPEHMESGEARDTSGN